MHDVEHQLAVVEARDIHSIFHVFVRELGREGVRVAHHHHPAAAEPERHSLDTPGRRGLLFAEYLGAINCGVRQFEDRNASRRPLEGRAAEGLHAIDAARIRSGPA